jgi:glycyl-tRNA synthetase alpha chain
MDIQDLYLESLENIGIRRKEHDIRFMEGDWDAPTLGAWGLGWEVVLDGLEITQFTYFQQAGGIELCSIPIEITYGIERLAMAVQQRDNIYDLFWSKDITYGEIQHQIEVEQSQYNFKEADIKMLFRLFKLFEKEGKQLVSKKLPIPAYDYTLKCSHTFNLLEARGAISVTERTGYIARVRELAKLCAQLYIEEREKIGYPLLKEK